jgi:N-acetylglutamate synthase-like GNAT family acetyltransferase
MLFDREAAGSVRVRNAAAGDAEAVKRLYRQLVPGDDAVCVLPERLTQIADDDCNLLLVAVIAGSVVGTASLTICLDPMYRFQPYGLVENVIVSPGTRSQGIGAALMRALGEVASERDCSKLMLLSNAKRERAHTFFERCGFDGNTKRGFVLYRKDFAAG